MLSKLLTRIYFWVPDKLKGTILSFILKYEGGEMYSPTIRTIFKRRFDITVGYGSYGGCFRPSNKIQRGVSIGNYCSISSEIRIYRSNHPKEKFTTHPLLYN